jgi:hypothetical protein
MGFGRSFAVVLGLVVIVLPCAAIGQLQEQVQQEEPDLNEPPNPAAIVDRGATNRDGGETFGQALVPGRVIHAQQDTIIPVEFETAPRMHVPSMPVPQMIVNPQQERPPRSDPMIVTDPSTEAPVLESVTAQPEVEHNDPKPTAANLDPAGRRYITQPYTQLASVYRAIGQDEQANAVLLARAERLGELSPPFSPQGLWYR